MMKVLIFLCFALLIVIINALNQELIDKFMERVHKVGPECVEETKATPDDIAEILDKKDPSRHEGKCMLFCVQKKLHLMNEDGTIDKIGSVLVLDVIRDDPEMYKQVLTLFVKCGEKAKIYDDPCVTGSELAKCARDEAEAMGLDSSMFG